MVFLRDIEPSTLQSFVLGSSYVDLGIVDEEALAGGTTYLPNGMAVYLRIGFGQMNLVRDKDVVEEVGTGVAFVREATLLDLLPMQVVSIGKQMCAIAATAQHRLYSRLQMIFPIN